VSRLYVGIVYGDRNLLPQRAQRTTEEDQVLPLMTLIFGKQIFGPVYSLLVLSDRYLGRFTVYSCYRTDNLGWFDGPLVLSET
jgi:hypothetical protein